MVYNWYKTFEHNGIMLSINLEHGLFYDNIKLNVLSVVDPGFHGKEA